MVPDSLISEFRTAGGRKVYDGGGIVPDVKIEAEYVSRFALTLYAMGFMEDWADKYVREHDIESVDVRNFALTDADYEDFCNYIKECDVPYESETRRALAALEKAAENDRYNELLGDAIAELRELVKDDKMSNMQTYRSEIQDALAADVVLRYAYSSGVAEFTAVPDPLVEQAIALLLDAEQYNKILEEQDLEMH
jgi:carboxyl-terminal processing protease